jgi:hypothetical protein
VTTIIFNMALYVSIALGGGEGWLHFVKVSLCGYWYSLHGCA